MTKFEDYLARESYRLAIEGIRNANPAQQFTWNGPRPDLRIFVERIVAEWPWMHCDDATQWRVNMAIVEWRVAEREREEREYRDFWNARSRA